MPPREIMKLVNRVFRDNKCYTYDIKTGNRTIEELNGSEPDLYVVNRTGLIPVDCTIFQSLKKENTFIHVSEPSKEYVAVYTESPECKGRTYAWYDIFILDANGQIVLSETKVDIGGASSSYFLDEMVVAASKDAPAADLHVRKHVQTGHKADDEYHAVWHWDKNGIHKGNWIFVGSNKGY